MKNEQGLLTIAIRYDDAGNEGSISGLPESLRQVRQFMMDFIESDRSEVIIATLDVDPAPYDRCLKFLSIHKDSGDLKVSVIENRLEITGDTDSIEALADWFDFSDDTSHGFHHHLWGDWVHPQSIPLVIMCKLR
jgi:hypothetical protein